ncbi:MAG: hypothetical protein AAF721_14215 [Myxococcota bacterium]
MLRSIAFVLPVAALCGAFVVPSSASACEPYPCLPGSLLPAGGTIPANTPELRWHAGMNATVKSPKRHLQLRSGGKKVAFDVEPLGRETFRIIVAKPLVEGQTYTLRADNVCKYVGPKAIESTFVVGPSVPMPTELGRVTMSTAALDTLQIGTSGGSCKVDERAVWADLAIALSPGAAPWAEMMDFTTTVDDRQWRFADTIGRPPPPGQSVIGRGKARIYARCAEPTEAFEGAGQGEHTIRMGASVFASGATLETSNVMLSLHCDQGATLGASGAPSRAGVPTDGGGASGPKDAGGVVAADSGTPPDEDPTPAAARPVATAAADPGAHAKGTGGCRIGDEPFGAWWACLLLARGRQSASRRRTRRM